MKARLFQTNFTGGEISPRAFARTDVRRHANAATGIENMIVGVRGETTRRSGTYFVGAAKNPNGRVRLVRFEVSTIAAYVIEFGNLYMRFWRNRAPVESSPGVPVEVATPYTEAQLRDLRFAQSADVLYICHRSHQPRKMSRTSPTAFSLSTVAFQDGPWQDENSGTTTLTPSARTGSVTVTASAAAFSADDVGRLISIRDDAPERAAATAYAVGDVVSSFYAGVSRLYRCVTGGTTPVANMTSGIEPPYDKNAPREETDAVRDGGVVWKYLGRGKSAWGWGTITAVGSATSATVAVTDPFPSTGACRRWRLGEWGGSRGWPGVMTFHSNRTVWAGSTAKPQTFWTSETGDFESMSPNEADGAVLDTNAITGTLDDDQVNSIRWATSFNGGLFFGAPSGEFVVNVTNRSGALSPTNITATRKGDRGSSGATSGLRAGNALLFVSQNGKQLREFVYDFSTDAFKAADLTVMAEHITGKGIVDAVRQRDPALIWCCTDDGRLLSLTYDQDEEVRAWSRHMRTVGFPLDDTSFPGNPVDPNDPLPPVAIGRTWAYGNYDQAQVFVSGVRVNFNVAVAGENFDNVSPATPISVFYAPAGCVAARVRASITVVGLGGNSAGTRTAIIRKVLAGESTFNTVVTGGSAVHPACPGFGCGPYAPLLVPWTTIPMNPGDGLDLSMIAPPPFGLSGNNVWYNNDLNTTFFDIVWMRAR